MFTMLEYDFMQNAFAASGIVGVLSGLVGYFLVLRRQTFAAHALSHVGFAGTTGAVLLGLNPMAGLIAVTLMAGAWMGTMAQKLENSDVAIAAVLSLSLGLGVLFLHFYTSFAAQATSLLFGHILGVDIEMVWQLLGIAIICLLLLGFISRPMIFASLQSEVAEAKGVNLRLISVLFLCIVALCTAACIQIVGVLLVFTLLVGPAATAQQLSCSLKRGVLLSALLAPLQAWIGLTLAFYSDWPASFWITAVSSLSYLAALGYSKFKQDSTKVVHHEHSHEH